MLGSGISDEKQKKNLRWRGAPPPPVPLPPTVENPVKYNRSLNSFYSQTVLAL